MGCEDTGDVFASQWRVTTGDLCPPIQKESPECSQWLLREGLLHGCRHECCKAWQARALEGVCREVGMSVRKNCESERGGMRVR